MSAHPIPTREGHYWAQWRICSPGTADEEEFEPSMVWEVVQVFENCIDRTAPEYLMVAVPGVEKGQALDAFVWGPRVEDFKP